MRCSKLTCPSTCVKSVSTDIGLVMLTYPNVKNGISWPRNNLSSKKTPTHASEKLRMTGELNLSFMSKTLDGKDRNKLVDLLKLTFECLRPRTCNINLWFKFVNNFRCLKWFIQVRGRRRSNVSIVFNNSVRHPASFYPASRTNNISPTRSSFFHIVKYLLTENADLCNPVLICI